VNVAKKQKKKKKSQAKGADESSLNGLFNFAPDSYLERTSRPIYAIFFLLPFIIFYEIGTILINTNVLNQTEVRVVAFMWLREALASIGLGGKFAWVAPPIVVVAILIGLQLSSRKKWEFDVRDVVAMTVECVGLAVPLIVLSLFLSTPAGSQGDVPHNSGVAVTVRASESDPAAGLPCLAAEVTVYASAQRGLLPDVVTGIGAGIYEELVFRLILICVLMIVFQDVLRLSHRSSVILSVMTSAALFSAHHHVIFLNGQLGRITDFNWTKFGFRTMAGVYFAILYAIRGFGITAGTHAFYDIIATIINAVFFAHE